MAFLGELTPSERRRAGLLITTRRRATGLLLAVAVIFALSIAFHSRAHWLSWIEATAVASLVGGLADWFAVTALFRHPLGLPIPHTAIVVERKDRFAETLGSFVQENFLTPAAVSDRLRTSHAIERTATYLANPTHASELSARIAEALGAAIDLVNDEDVHGLLDVLVKERIDKLSLAPLAGRLLAELTRDGRHDPLVDSALRSLSQYIDRHGGELHQRLGVYSPWWVPDTLGDRMVKRLLARSSETFMAMAVNPDHPLRQELDAAVVKLAEELQSSLEMRRRGEELKDELVGQPQIRAVATAVWGDIKAELRSQSAQPGSQLRERLCEIIVQIGRRLSTDRQLAESVTRSLDAVICALLERFDVELSALVSTTISHWDARETSRRLELLLGPDLQYIRINGTVVGGLAGLALHAISVAIS